MQNAL
jgi:AP-4 complex subunit beta-1